MTDTTAALLQQWRRLKTVVEAASSVVDANPKVLAAVIPLVERAGQLLQGRPTPDAIDEIEYNVQRAQEFVAKWRPTRGVSGYIQPGFARDTDRECQEALRLLAEIRRIGSANVTEEASEDAMKIFVSHSSVDKDIATAFVELLRAALPLSANDIRCTSVDGYRLPPGSNADAELRKEVFEAAAFVALLSPQSIQSVYVMFELGARWGTNKPLLPVMIAGIDPSFLKAPLSAINAVAGTSEAGVHELIGALAGKLMVQQERPAAYLKALQAFVSTAKARP